MEPGVERCSEARFVGVDAALTHHDDREADQPEQNELEGRGKLGDGFDVEDAEHDDHGEHRHGD